MAKNELVALALLSVTPMHTYLINNIIEKMHLEKWAHVSRASLYSALKKLESTGAVSVASVRNDGLPDRKVFSITEQGIAQLHVEYREALTTTEQDGSLFHLGINLFFGGDVNEGIAWIEERIQSLQIIRDQLKQQGELHAQCGHVIAQQTLHAAYRHVCVEIETTQGFVKIIHDDPTYFIKAKELLLHKISCNDAPERNDK